MKTVTTVVVTVMMAALMAVTALNAQQAGSTAAAQDFRGKVGAFDVQIAKDELTDKRIAFAIVAGQKGDLSVAWRCDPDSGRFKPSGVTTFEVSVMWNKYLPGLRTGKWSSVKVYQRFPGAEVKDDFWQMGQSHKAASMRPTDDSIAFTDKALAAPTVMIRVEDPTSGEQITDTLSLAGLAEVKEKLGCIAIVK